MGEFEGSIEGLIRRMTEVFVQNERARTGLKRSKKRTKDCQIFFRCYSEFYEKLEVAAHGEEKDVNEYVVKVMCEKLGLDYMKFK